MNIFRKSVCILLTAVIVSVALCSCNGGSQMVKYDRPGFLLDKSSGIIVFSLDEGYSLKYYPHTENEITLPSELYGTAVSETYEQVFMSDDSLESVHIPNGYRSLGYCTFAYCNNLKSVYIPESVVEMDEAAFCSCPNVTVYCESTQKPEGWHENWHSDCDNIQVVWGYGRE